jgi:hypothetical protein
VFRIGAVFDRLQFVVAVEKQIAALNGQDFVNGYQIVSQNQTCGGKNLTTTFLRRTSRWGRTFRANETPIRQKTSRHSRGS